MATASKFKITLSDAKRWLSDPMGFYLVREFLLDGISNRVFNSSLQEGVTFITLTATKTLVFNVENRSIHIQS